MEHLAAKFVNSNAMHGTVRQDLPADGSSCEPVRRLPPENDAASDSWELPDQTASTSKD
jgi:hypothetical protein